MIYRSSSEMPRNLRDYALWQQVFDGERWYTSNSLRASDARALARWLDAHHDVRWLRIYAERI